MIFSKQIRDALRNQPFRPFRIVLSDGVTHDIRHPDLVRIVAGALYIGVPPVGEPVGPGIEYMGMEVVGLDHVVKIVEPVPGATAAASA